MIVRDAGPTLQLITQPDHAALARRVMERWTPLHNVERRASILLAIEEHDNGWREVDAVPLIDPASGRPFDFVRIPANIRQDVWPRAVSRLAQDDVWAGALVAHHAVTVYDRFRADPAWASFFPRLERMRDDLAVSTRRTHTQLLADYAFVRIGDLISLVFCAQWDEPQSYQHWSFQRDGDRVLVTPKAIGTGKVPISVNAREIPARRYADDADVQRTARMSPVITLRGEVADA